MFYQLSWNLVSVFCFITVGGVVIKNTGSHNVAKVIARLDRFEAVILMVIVPKVVFRLLRISTLRPIRSGKHCCFFDFRTIFKPTKYLTSARSVTFFFFLLGSVSILYVHDKKKIVIVFA